MFFLFISVILLIKPVSVYAHVVCIGINKFFSQVWVYGALVLIGLMLIMLFLLEKKKCMSLCCVFICLWDCNWTY